MNHIYKNKYGKLEIEVIGSYQVVSKIDSRELNKLCFFGVDDVEKIALISGNRGIQLAFAAWDLRKAYLLHHKSPSLAAVCRIISLDFDKTINARRELERPNPFFIENV